MAAVSLEALERKITVLPCLQDAGQPVDTLLTLAERLGSWRAPRATPRARPNAGSGRCPRPIERGRTYSVLRSEAGKDKETIKQSSEKGGRPPRG